MRPVPTGQGIERPRLMATATSCCSVVTRRFRAHIVAPDSGCYAVLRKPEPSLHHDALHIYQDSALVFHYATYQAELPPGVDLPAGSQVGRTISTAANRVSLHPLRRDQRGAVSGDAAVGEVTGPPQRRGSSVDGCHRPNPNSPTSYQSSARSGIPSASSSPTCRSTRTTRVEPSRSKPFSVSLTFTDPMYSAFSYTSR